MKKIFTFCNIYILLWIIYMMQDVLLGSTGTLIATVIVLFLVAVSLYYTVYAISHYKFPQYMKGLALLLAMFTLYGLVLVISGRVIVAPWGVVANYNYLKKIYISLLPIFPFYVFTKKGILNEHALSNWFIVFMIMTIISFNYKNQQFHDELGKEEVTNNVGYTFLSLIPLLVFWKRNREIQYLGLAVTMAFVFMSFKRGAIIIGVTSAIIFMLNITKNAKRKQRIWTIVLGIALLIIGYLFIEQMMASSEYFNKRLDDTFEGNSSGRNELYSFYWNHFINEDNPLLFLFGNGANATLTLSFNYAHNDWLELAINQGVLGLFVYLVYWVLFYKSWRRSAFDSDIHLAIGLSLVIYFLKTIFSMSYTDMTLYSNICIGYCMARLSEQNIHYKMNK